VNATANKEIGQLHNRAAFTPIHFHTLTPQEHKKIMQNLTFLTEKRDGRVKCRSVADGPVQRNWMDCEEKASPTAQLESIFLMAVIEAKEE
jgi:hypothetical protein